MRKKLMLAIYCVLAINAYSQDTIKVQPVQTPEVVAVPVEKTTDTAAPVTQIIQMPDNSAANANVLNSMDSLKTKLDVLKSLNEGGNKDGIIIVGNNVIVGNNNTIYVVNERAQLKDVMKRKKKESEKPFSNRFMDHFSISLKASTMGPGVEIATSLSKNFTLRAGYSYMDYTTNSFKIKTDDENIRNAVVGNFDPKYKTEADLKFNNGNAMVDFYPMASGVFHITAGAYFGSARVKSVGALVDANGNKVSFNDPSNPPSVNLDDYALTVNSDATLNFEMEMGNVIKPYVGIGLGRTIPRSNFGIAFELGVLYQGDYVIKQNGKELEQKNNLHESFKDAGDYTKWMKYYPIANLQLIYRFK